MPQEHRLSVPQIPSQSWWRTLSHTTTAGPPDIWILDYYECLSSVFDIFWGWTHSWYLLTSENDWTEAQVQLSKCTRRRTSLNRQPMLQRNTEANISLWVDVRILNMPDIWLQQSCRFHQEPQRYCKDFQTDRMGGSHWTASTRYTKHCVGKLANKSSTQLLPFP